MGNSGLYECTECEYWVYSAENGTVPDGCPECGGELETRTIPRKDWLAE